MPVWRREGFVEDRWLFAPDGQPISDAEFVVVSLTRWLAERAALERRAPEVGVAVDAGADAQRHLSDLVGRPFVALAFSKFVDGRAFSYARLLRDRYGFKGELRATGDVLIDEIPFMLACGFDSLEINDAATVRRLEKGSSPQSRNHFPPNNEAGDASMNAPSWRTATRVLWGASSSEGPPRSGPDRSKPRC